MTEQYQHDPRQSGGVSRRRLIGGAGAGLVVGAAAGVGGGYAAFHGSSREVAQDAGGDTLDLSVSYPFYAPAAYGHQGGVGTEPQRHIVFMTFDIVPGTTKQQLQTLLAQWSAGIAQMQGGLPIGAIDPTGPSAVAADTGEAYELAPSALTVTLGLGPGFFSEEYGLAAHRPKLLQKLPQLPSDAIQPALDGGDISLQACADDPQVAYHAIRDLARLGRGTVVTKWTVLGFGRASAGAGQKTPRNLLGFKDGTRNLKTDGEFDKFVWLTDDDVPWMRGGTYQVARKIEMNIEIWDADRVSDQDTIFGRAKQSGAPLTGKTEFDTPDFEATKDGQPVISPKSHISLAAFEHNDGVRILRRSYNYTDGINDLGHLDAGLLFIAYMNDPAHFVQLQTKLGGSDLLNEYISHIGSGIFAVPPAPKKGDYLASALFA